jgi:2,4-dienoyl-CoA reductase (NADPH2)
VVEESDTLGQGMNFLNMWVHCQWLDQKGVRLISGARYESIDDKGLLITTRDGQKECLEADSIIPMTPLEPDDHLLKTLKGKVSEVHACGSCINPGLIRDAVNEGFKVGFAL